ncbi:MAG: AI-2E family transporter [Flavobacteriaceae bacterium]|jgi:predicted PurR-regulated permease PerM|nr:AI-2E family transporter [Flavobacteriaceae bacterium]
MNNITYKEISKGILSAVAVIAVTVLLVYLLWQVRFVIGYIFVSFAFSLMGHPMMVFLKKLRISNAISALMTITLIFGIFFILISLFIPLAMQQAENLSLLDTHKLQETVTEQIKTIDEALRSKNIFLFDDNYVKLLTPRFEYKIHQNTLQDSFSVLMEIAVSLFSIVFITFFFLWEKDLFNKAIIGIAPTKDDQKVAQVLMNIKNLLTRYFLGLTLQISAMFVLYIIILLSFGIENAVIIAVFCACLNLIPYFGPLIGFFIVNLLSISSMFSQGADFNQQILPNILWISGFYLLAQVADNAIFQPLIYAKSVKSHPLEIFLVMLVAGMLFGAVGVIFAVPGYTVLRVILKNFFNQFKIVQFLTKNM